MFLKNQLGYIRVSRGLSQQELAKISGISRHAISEIELDKRVPKLMTALMLAHALECRVEDIFSLQTRRVW